MRVLYLIDSLRFGGSERSLVELLRRSRAFGIHAEVGTFYQRPGFEEDLVRYGIPHHFLGSGGSPFSKLSKTYELVRRTRPDLVHTTLFEANLLGRGAGLLGRTPTVSSLVNSLYGPEHLGDPDLLSAKVRMAQTADALSARAARRLHSVSEHVADVMSKKLRYPRHRIDVVPRGRDALELGRRTAERRERVRTMLGAGSACLIVAVARHEYQKGLDLLIDAFHEIQSARGDARLVIIGAQGKETPRIRDLLKQLRLEDSVDFLQGRHDVPELLCAADVFVMSSRREGSPGALLEALALEAPIVAGDIPTVREVLGECLPTALVPLNASAIAKRVVTVLDDIGAQKVLTERGRELFLERYTIDRIGERMLRFYERALA